MPDNKQSAQVDGLSLERIQLLHPKRRIEATQILTEIHCKTSTPNSFCRFAFTLRTFDEQAQLYAQGRTKPGPVVTNAKPGYSYHNYGLAIDIAFVINKTTASWSTTTDWDKDNEADWMEVVKIFKAHGWGWGGDWKTFKDLPHFEKADGKSVDDLYKLYKAGKVDLAGYVIF